MPNHKYVPMYVNIYVLLFMIKIIFQYYIVYCVFVREDYEFKLIMAIIVVLE